MATELVMLPQHQHSPRLPPGSSAYICPALPRALCNVTLLAPELTGGWASSSSPFEMAQHKTAEGLAKAPPEASGGGRLRSQACG